MTHRDLYAKSARGFVLTLASSGVRLGTGVLAHLILVRFLFPEDFGDFAVLVLILNGFVALATLSVGTYAVQCRNDPERAISAAFTCQLAWGVFITAALVSSSFYLPALIGYDEIT